MTVTIRAERVEDHPAIREVIVAAFGDEGPVIADLVDALRKHPCTRDGLSLVADDEGEIVAHSMVTRSRLDTFRRVVDVAVLGPLAVRPDRHRQGIGRQIVAASLAGADTAGFPVIFLEGDPAYYSRLGWVAAKPLGFRKPSIRIPDDAFQCVLLSAYEGWMTGTHVYNEVFWDFDAIGLREPELMEWLAGEVAEGRQL